MASSTSSGIIPCSRTSYLSSSSCASIPDKSVRNVTSKSPSSATLIVLVSSTSADVSAASSSGDINFASSSENKIEWSDRTPEFVEVSDVDVPRDDDILSRSRLNLSSRCTVCATATPSTSNPADHSSGPAFVFTTSSVLSTAIDIFPCRADVGACLGVVSPGAFPTLLPPPAALPPSPTWAAWILAPRPNPATGDLLVSERVGLPQTG
mmetsp:Transcript_15227/g.43305  ORF Transcript_15227/g.43305 Transcript_15227/m.43305 type:complete len:209 (+) Transcript_15227:1278-1904(+)